MRHRVACVGMIAALGLVAGCVVPDPGRADLAATGAGLSDRGIVAKFNQHYGSAPDQVYDLYRPQGVGAPPLVIFVHGGGWGGGTRTMISALYSAAISQLTTAGWAVATIDYRLTAAYGTTPEGQGQPHPAQVRDITRAIRWFKAHGSEIGVDGRRPILAGHSAGGHLALLAGLSCAVASGKTTCAPEFQTPSAQPSEDLKNQDSRPAGIIAFAPITDPTVLREPFHPEQVALAVAGLLGCPQTNPLCNDALAATTKPAAYLDPSDPPIYLAYGTTDSYVPSTQSTSFAAVALPTLGNGGVWVDAVEGANHNLGSPAFPNEPLSGVNATMVTKFATHIRDAQP